MSSIKGGYTPGWAAGEIAYGLTGHQAVSEVSESQVSDSEHAAFTFTTDTGQVFKVTVTTVELSDT